MTTIEHLLCCLGEEGSEIAQDVSKMLRFGAHAVNCLQPEGPNNTERLVNELNDLLGVASMLVGRGVLPPDWHSMNKQHAKVAKVLQFMEYARSKGTIID